MLSLRVNNQVLDLGDDISISWELRNPMFYEMGSRSYPFKIKNTPYNQKILGYRHRIEGTNNVYQEFPCEIAFKGIDMFRGTLKFRVLNNQYYEGTVYDREGDFYYQAKNTSLRDVNFGEQSYASASAALTYINGCRGLYYPDRPVCYPQIINEVYFDPPSNDIAQTRYNYVDIDGLIHEFGTGENRSLIVPCLYFRFVLNKVIDYLGYHFSDQFFGTNSDFNKLVIYNSLSNNSLCQEFSYDLTKLYYNLHLPKITILEFLSSVESFFNVRFFVDPIEKVITVKSLIDIVNDISSIDYSAGLISSSIELDEKRDGFLLKIPIDGSDTFIKTLSEDQDTYLKSILPPVESVNNLPAWPYSMIGDLRYVYDTGKYYRLGVSKTWAEDVNALKYMLSQFYVGNYKESLDIKMSGLKNDNIPFNPYPRAQCGNPQADWNDISLRVFFMKLIHETSPPGYYIDFGYESTANYYLWFNGVNNVYVKFHKDWLNFLCSTKAVKIQRRMSLSDIRNLDFSKKVLIDSNKFFIRRLQVTLKKNEITTSAMECLTVK